MLPLRNGAGNALVAFHPAEETSTQGWDPLPLALVVVLLGDTVLLGFNEFRREWELPGGQLDPGETPLEAAARELAEETGIAGVGLTFAAIVEFELRRPHRCEFAAVYRTELRAAPTLVVNAEMSDFLWWRPGVEVPGLSVLDVEIAGRVAGWR